MKDGKIKSFLKESFMTKPLYKVYAQVKKKKHNIARRNGLMKFNNNSIEVMGTVQRVFSSFPGYIDFFFAYGTLLGIIRDGELLGRDMDLDMSVFLEDDNEIIKFREYLQTKGFMRLHSFYVNNVGISQDTFLFKDVAVDIHYSKKEGEKYRNYIFFDLPEEKNKVLFFSFTHKGSVPIVFKQLLINVPSNPELYLTEIYGNDWKVPNPDYIYWENPLSNKTDFTGKVEIISKFKYS